MSRSKDHAGKAEARRDYVGGGMWWNDKQVLFTEYHQNNLLKICNDPDFVAAVNRVAGQYMSREKPKAPLSDIEPRFQKDYKNRHVQPTLADMKKTLQDLQKTDNKVKWLNKRPKVHPIWGIMRRAWYKEHKVQLNRVDFDRIHEVADFQYMLETTPNDHPQWQAMQDSWDKEHKTDFEKLNNGYIPNLVEICLKHLKQQLKDIYLSELSDSNTHKIWLAWHLGLVFNRFGLKISCTKNGPLTECLRIVLDAAGVRNKDNKPIENTHKYIKPAVLKELKKPRS